MTTQPQRTGTHQAAPNGRPADPLWPLDTQDTIAALIAVLALLGWAIQAYCGKVY